MGVTFISNSGGVVKAGTIVLWFGAKADIPAGWAYYSAAAGKLVAGATSASTTALGVTTHTHTYSANTGDEGAHTHSVSLSQGQPINATIPGLFYQSSYDAIGAGRYHSNHPFSGVTVSNNTDHNHVMLTTGSSTNLLPPSFGLFYIRKA